MRYKRAKRGKYNSPWERTAILRVVAAIKDEEYESLKEENEWLKKLLAEPEPEWMQENKKVLAATAS